MRLAKKSVFLVVLVLLLFSNVKDSNSVETSPVVLKVENTVVGGYLGKVATLTSMIDSIVITKITVNRGNVDASIANENLPKILKFGEGYVFGVPNFLEVKVDTDKGAWVFKGQ